MKRSNKSQSEDNQELDQENNAEPNYTEEFDEVISGLGFMMARKGRFIFTDTSRTEEEHQEILANLAGATEGIEKSIEQQIQELEAIIAQFNPFDIIGYIFFENAIINAEAYQEYEHEGNDAYTEYIALLCLTKPFNFFAPRSPEPISGEIIQGIQERIKRLFFDTVYYFVAKDTDPEQKTPDRLTQLRFHVLTRSLFVRYSSYHHHLLDVLRGIFTRLQDVLESVVGFNIDDAIALANGIERLTRRRLSERIKIAQEKEKELRKVIKVYRKKRRKIGDYPVEWCERLANMRPSEAAIEITKAMIAWEFFALGDTMQFTPQELADETGVALERVKVFLEKLSIGFGEVDPTYYRAPSPTPLFITKPLMKHQDRYFAPVSNCIYSSLQPAIEALLNPINPEALNTDDTLWHRYERTRASYLEDKAIEYVSNALRQATVYHNLKYQVNENGEQKEVELDGLLMLDSALCLVEAKAGTLTLPARRGAPRRMMAEIDELVDKAHEQALRAKHYVQNTEEAVFYLEDGSQVKINRDNFDHFFLINVTLDDLDAFVTNLYELQGLGFLQSSELPWSVSLNNLRVISEMTEFSSQFLHYLLRRDRLNQLKRTQAYDELDWFGHYLLEGLFFDEILDGDAPNIINLLSYTTDFDNYYLYETGRRQSYAPKPMQPMPDILRQMIAALDAEHLANYLKAACALLDMSGTTRKEFVEGVQRQRSTALEDRNIHDFSIMFNKPGFGITYMLAPVEKFAELSEKIEPFCILKKYQNKINLWIGFGCIVDRPGWIHYVLVLDDAWQYDEELDKLVRENLPPLPQALSDSSSEAIENLEEM